MDAPKILTEAENTVAKIEAVVVADAKKAGDGLAKFWKAVLAFLRFLLAPVLDNEWHPDPYKIGGYAAFGFAAFLALQVLDAARVASPNATVILALAGLVSAFVTVGTFLFSQGRRSDADLIARQQGQAPKVGGQ